MKRTIKLLCAALYCIFTLTTVSWAQMMTKDSRSSILQSSMPAAEAGLELLRNINAEKGKESGSFALSSDEVYSMELGVALQHYLVRLDHLKAYDGVSDPRGLLSDQNQLSYPIMANTGVVGSVTVTLSNDKWELASVGDALAMANTVNARKLSARYTGVAEEGHILVNVAALNRYYVGSINSDGLFLTLITKSGVSQSPKSAHDVFRELSETAQNVEDLPH